MADSTEKEKLVQIVELLHKHGVEFMLIGGQAAVVHGSPIPTFDIDLCYRRTEDNLKKLAEALKEIHPTLRGAPADLPFRLDAESLALGQNFTFKTDLGDLDLLGWVEPFGTYDELVGRAENVSLETCDVNVISLDDLIAIKKHINRPKDRNVLLQLEALKKLQEGE